MDPASDITFSDTRWAIALSYKIGDYLSYIEAEQSLAYMKQSMQTVYTSTSYI